MEGENYRQQDRSDQYDGLAPGQVPAASTLQGNDLEPGFCETLRGGTDGRSNRETVPVKRQNFLRTHRSGWHLD